MSPLLLIDSYQKICIFLKKTQFDYNVNRLINFCPLHRNLLSSLGEIFRGKKLPKSKGKLGFKIFKSDSQKLPTLALLQLYEFQIRSFNI